VGGEHFGYWISELPTAIPGRAFHLTRFGHTGDDADGDYRVLVGSNPADTSCECKGWAYRGRCKHTAGLAALVAARKL
jgi:hypothetical protein